MQATREITGIALIDEAGKVCDRHGLISVGPTLAYDVAKVLLKLEAESAQLRAQVAELEQQLSNKEIQLGETQERLAALQQQLEESEAGY